MTHEFLPARDLARARRLRREMTDAERKLWAALRAHRFLGLGFRRQAPIGRYVADFLSHQAKLVVEVDGGQHGFATRAAADRTRDAWLRSRGYRVLRFWNADVLTDLDSVLMTIEAGAPPSQPSPARGEGARDAAAAATHRRTASRGRTPAGARP